MGCLGFSNITLARFFTSKKNPEQQTHPNKQKNPNQQLKPNGSWLYKA